MANESILNFPWFPKTDPAHSGGGTYGEWQGQDQGFLGRFANDLVYERANSRINSLPSPWSRALQFEQAIFNPRYPTRPDLLEELFGCLATVGLWEIIGNRFEAEHVDLSHFAADTDESVGPFARSLNGQRPSADTALYELQDGSNPWSSIYILKTDGLVIGFTSPSTLVCPSVYLSSPLQGMRWTAERRFTSPTPYLSKQQRQALADWLDYIRKGILDAQDLKCLKTVGSVSDIINGFIHELSAGQLGSPVLSEKGAPGFPPRPVAVSLLARAAGAKAASSTSMATLEIGDRKDRPITGASSKSVVLVDPQMSSKLGIPANEITLFGASTLEAVGASTEKLEQLYGHEIDVITPDDLFAPELYLLPKEAALTNTWLYGRMEGRPTINGAAVTPILPLRERVRDILSSRELESSCTLRVVSTARGVELEITLMLRIRGMHDAYPLSRSYPIKEENLIDEDLPVIAVWPNVSDERWRRFYIFCQDKKTGLTVDGFSDYELRIGKEGQDAVKYFISKRFPDFVKLTERGRQCGLIPVSVPAESASTVTSWSVGIDFGTSFTNFFVHDGTSPSRKMLETRLLPLTLAEKESQLNTLTKFFIPEDILPKGVNPPTSTALNTYGWQSERGVVPEIFHQARIHWPSTNALSMRGPGVHTGFKWSETEYQKPFLKQMALLITCNGAAEGVAKINWSVSYPSAFSRRHANTYRKCWEDLCAELRLITGLDHELIEDDGRGGLQTEAIAFANYFRSYRAKQVVHAACLDVGGGTTDVSIWQEDSLLHQVSIPFAGRDICTRIMQMKPVFMRSLFKSSAAGDIANDEAKLRQDPNFNGWFDNCLRYESEILLLERLPVLRAQQDKQLNEFVSLMAIGFAGLYHYLGLILKGLSMEKSLMKQTPMDVYMGGNGARFMHWLDESGRFTKACETDELMEAVQTMSASFTSGRIGNALTTLSNAFKDETACGLVSNGGNLKGDFDPRHHRMFAGERVTINRSTFDIFDRVIEPEDGIVSQYDLVSNDELRRFTRNYDTILKSLQITSLMPISKLATEARLWSDVDTEIRAICLEKMDKEFIELDPEPPFFTGLKGLVRVLAREWAERF